jgi:hypothetical protein
MRCGLAGAKLSQRYSTMSIGRPTDRLLRIVESKEISAHLAASASEVSRCTTRSIMGLPYLASPICK